MITTITSIIIKCFILIHYLDSTIDYRYSKKQSYFTVAIIYTVYCFICILNITLMNLICGVLAILFATYLSYKIKFGRAIVQTIIIQALSMFSELIASLAINVQISDNVNATISLTGDIVYSTISTIMFFMLIALLTNLTNKNHAKHGSRIMTAIIILPISTCAFLLLFNQLHGSINTRMEYFCIIISVMLVISNLIVYIVCELLIDRNIKIQALQDLKHKEDLNNKSYELIKEKYEELKIMVHDFDKYCSNIDALVSSEQSNVLSLTQQIRNKNKDFLLIEYTNNQALNILLSQKTEECNKENIDFQLYVKDIDLSFIEELDVISIFANLIDNAIESCRLSNHKKIFFSIKIMNGSYIVINIENSADNEPVVINNRLLSIKQDKNKHGLGFASINKHLEKYNGRMRWNYNKESHIFNTTIMINYPAIRKSFDR